MRSIYSILSINKVQTTAYHARGNGDCERANKDISIILKKLIKDKYSSWPTKLNAVAFAMNSAVHASTGFTPSRLQFGRELRTPADLVYDTTTTEEYKSECHLAYAQYQDLRVLFDLVRSNLGTSQQLQKASYDKKKGFHTTYSEGDTIVVWIPLSPSVKDYRKFKNNYSGPWKIKKVLSKWTYLVQHLKNDKERVVHFDTMRLIPDGLRTSQTQLDCSKPDDPDSSPTPLLNKRTPDEDENLPMMKLMMGTTTTTRVKDKDEEEQTITPDTDTSTREIPYSLRTRVPIKYTK